MTSPFVILDKPLRDGLCHHLHRELLLSGKYPLTPAACIRPFKTAWSDISTESTVRVPEKCYMSDSMNQTESDALWVKDDENSSYTDESAESNLFNK